MCAYAKPRCCSMVPAQRATTEIAARTGITAGLAAIRRQDGEPACRSPPVQPLTWPDQAVAPRARGWPRGGLGTHLRTARAGASQRPNGAALVGVAPLNQDSGQQRGLRCAWGACAAASKNYYMATMTAFRHNPATPAFHICLCQRGKSRKVALVASRRKLPLILNAVIQDQSVSLATAGTRFSCRGLTRNSAACYSVLLDNRIQLKSGHEICNTSLHIAQQQRFGWLVGQFCPPYLHIRR